MFCELFCVLNSLILPEVPQKVPERVTMKVIVVTERFSDYMRNKWGTGVLTGY